MMKRRKVSLLGKVRRSRTERTPVATITSEWIERHQHILTPRDIEMMRILTVFPLATIEHLHALTPRTTLRRGQTIKAFHECTKGMQLCRDRVRKLFDHHFVNKYAPQLALGEGTSPQYVWLDRAGYRLFQVEGRPPKQLSSEYLHHKHILDAYCMVRNLEREGILSIDYFEPCYATKPKTVNIEPDLILAFRKGNYGYRYLIEVDNCEKKESEELRKIETYRDWELGSQWIKEDWANLYKRRFPILLYLFSGSERKINRRIKVFKQKADEVECRSDFLPLEHFREKILSLPE
jgi:hypothetical protein